MESDVVGTRFGSRKLQTALPNYNAVAPAFNPTSLIVTAGGFWRADMGVTLSGSNVTQWNDQSSFANNLTNTGTASNATFSASGFNGSFPAVSFPDNSNGNMQVAGAFAATTTASIFMLLSPNCSTTALRWGWLAVGAGTDFTTPSFVCFENTLNSFDLYSSGFQESGNGATTNGTPVLLGGVFNGANGAVWVNGSSQGLGGSFNSNLGGASSKFGIGSSVSASAVGAHYAFWGITQKAMNTTDWTNLKNWANSNWGTSF